MIPISQPLLDGEEQELVAEVLASGQIASGSRVEAFERAFASFVGAKYAVATSSGTAALHVALLAAGIGPGDRVITTPFTFAATANAILMCGAEPVFVDVDPQTLNISPAEIARAARDPGVRAVLVVHLYGLPCEMGPILETVRARHLILIEDCAQAHGATYRGRHVGTFGLAGAFSFYATKNMTTGEGGMIVTQDEELARQARALINHGSFMRYHYEMLGYNYRMSEIGASLGLAQLEKLTAFNQARRRNADYYFRALSGLPWLRLPATREEAQHVFHQYTLRLAQRDLLCRHLEEHGVGYGIYYPLPLHRQPLYARLGYAGLSLPEAERAAQEVVSIPVHPGLSGRELQHIVQVIHDFAPPQLL